MNRFFLLLALAVSPLFSSSYLLHNHVIDDPYAYLEEMESKKTLQWLDEQENQTNQYYEKLSCQESLKEKLKLWTPQEGQLPPIRKNKALLSFHRPKGSDKFCLEIKSPSNETTTLIDPSAFESLDNPSLKGQVLSPKGQSLYFALTQSGSDFTTWTLYDLKNKQQRPSQITHTKFYPPIWSEQGHGLFYSKWQKGDFSDPDFNLGLYFHSNDSKDDQKDKVIVKNEDPNQILTPICQLDQNHLVYFQGSGSSSRSAIKVIDLKTHEVEEIVPEGFAKFHFIQKAEGKLYFLTDHQAENHKLIALPCDHFNYDQAEEVLSSSSHCLEDAALTKDYILGNYTIDCQSKVLIFDKKGHYLRDLPLHQTCNVSLGSMSSDFDSYSMNEIFFSSNSFLEPSSIHRCDLDQNQTELFFKPEIPKGNWVVKQVFYTSKDGTKVPMFICHSKDLVLDGKNPTLMWGYGGFGCSMTPYFSPHHPVWLDQGGVFVSVNLRGGLEYGKPWHDGGKLHNKQNVFDDFIGAAEYLIEKGYTSSEKLAIHGASNGGLLVGACITQRPKLFKAAVAQVPVMDMLKFHKYTIGKAWISDYGNPDDPEDFKVLYSYSPYHNVHKAEHHPSLLVLTADHDDRVVPLHSYKFVAHLKEVSKCSSPILLKLHRQQGHGAGGGSVQKRIDVQADILSFLCHELGMD